MTLDKLLIGLANADILVIEYLEKKSEVEIEEIFHPYFEVTRPEKSLRDSSGTNDNTTSKPAPKGKRKSEALARLTSRASLSEAQKKLLEEFDL